MAAAERRYQARHVTVSSSSSSADGTLIVAELPGMGCFGLTLAPGHRALNAAAMREARTSVISYGDSPDLYDASSASCSADAGSAVTGSAEVVDGTSDTALAAAVFGHVDLPSGVMRRGHLLTLYHRDTPPHFMWWSGSECMA